MNDFYEMYICDRSVSVQNLLFILEDDNLHNKCLTDMYDNLPMYLSFAKRYNDLKALFDHPEYSNKAKKEWNLYVMMVSNKAKDDQREAKMLHDYPQLRKSNDYCKSIHLGCLLFPHKSVNEKYSNMVVIVEGMGIAYFIFDGDTITLTKCLDRKLNPCLEEFNIVPWEQVSLESFENAMKIFAQKENVVPN